MSRNIDETKLAKVIAKAKIYLARHRREPGVFVSYSIRMPKEDRHDESSITAPPSPSIRELLRSGRFSDFRSLIEEIKEPTFVEKVNTYIQQKELRETTVYKAAQIDRRLFSKVMSDLQYRPSKDTALAIAFALQLSLAEAHDLLSRAGYILSHSDDRDIIMDFFFSERLYDLDEINYVLTELGLKCIGR